MARFTGLSRRWSASGSCAGSDRWTCRRSTGSPTGSSGRSSRDAVRPAAAARGAARAGPGREAHLVPRDRRVAGDRRRRGPPGPRPRHRVQQRHPARTSGAAATRPPATSADSASPTRPTTPGCASCSRPEFTMRRLERLRPRIAGDRRASSSTVARRGRRRRRPRPRLRVPGAVPGDLRAARAARRGARDLPVAGLRPLRRDVRRRRGPRGDLRARGSTSWTSSAASGSEPGRRAGRPDHPRARRRDQRLRPRRPRRRRLHRRPRDQREHARARHRRAPRASARSTAGSPTTRRASTGVVEELLRYLSVVQVGVPAVRQGRTWRSAAGRSAAATW